MTRAVFGREYVPVLTTAEAAEWDRTARADVGVPEAVLMENAGRSAALLLDRLYPDGLVAAAAGSGHNGGDALVLLRNLKAWGREVAWVCAGDRPPAQELLHGFDIPAFEDGADVFERAGVIIDGVLGTGARGAARGRAAAIIDRMNGSENPIVAIDLPSGVDADTGAVPGAAVRAHVTICIGSAKLGLMLEPAREHCGRIIVIEIGFPPLLDVPALLITPEWAARRLPRRSPDAHKATAGKLLILAGRSGMAGAAVIATRAALRAGAGLVYVASDARNRGVVQRVTPEAIFIDHADTAELVHAARTCAAVAAGPGLGTDEPARAALQTTFDAALGAALLDADALTLMAGDPAWLKRVAAVRPLVLTPHAGEMARLTGAEISAIVANRPAAALALAASYACTLLLKGAPSIVAADGRLLLATTGSSDLATAGMGDQLAGVIGAFLAAGVTPQDAAALGLFYGGRAADLAAKGRSLSPMDVSRLLPRAFRSPGRRLPPFGLPFINFDQPARH